MTIKYIHGQFVNFSLRALWRFGHAMVSLQRQEPNKAEEHLNIMKRHIDFIQECIDHDEFTKTSNAVTGCGRANSGAEF